jgi:hypothetical protein
MAETLLLSRTNPKLESLLSSESWQPKTQIGDVIVHHAAPKFWIPASVSDTGDLDGTKTKVSKTSRDAAVAAARELLRPGGRIYIRHHDDAIWEEVR